MVSNFFKFFFVFFLSNFFLCGQANITMFILLAGLWLIETVFSGGCNDISLLYD